MYEAAPPNRSDDADHPKYRHRCGIAECPFCQKYVPQDTHQCYIQPVKEDEDDHKLQCVPESGVGDRGVVGVNPETGGCYVEKNQPLFIYADYETTADEQGVQTPILLCCESAEQEDTTTFYGDDCTACFFNHLDDLTIDEYGDPRKVIIIFHNFKGYDGVFVLK